MRGSASLCRDMLCACADKSVLLEHLHVCALTCVGCHPATGECRQGVQIERLLGSRNPLH